MKKPLADIIPVVKVPFLLVVLMILAFVVHHVFEININQFGIRPKSFTGLSGVVFSPFLHGSFSHLFNNISAFIPLSFFLFYTYRKIASPVFWSIFFLSGIWTWLIGRPSNHIGASGVVYGLTAFLFLSGWLRKETQTMALSALVVFLYGSLIWGILPIKEGTSWEGHLSGAVAGIVLAILYRKKGPQRKKYDWEYEDDEDSETESYWRK